MLQHGFCMVEQDLCITQNRSMWCIFGNIYIALLNLKFLIFKDLKDFLLPCLIQRISDNFLRFFKIFPKKKLIWFNYTRILIYKGSWFRNFSCGNTNWYKSMFYKDLGLAALISWCSIFIKTLSLLLSLVYALFIYGFLRNCLNNPLVNLRCVFGSGLLVFIKISTLFRRNGLLLGTWLDWREFN